MPFSSTGLLQFDELKELVATFAGSLAGRELVRELEPVADRFELETSLAEAGEAIEYLREIAGAQEAGRGAAIRLRFDQLRETSSAVRTLMIEGASLEGREILDLFHNLSLASDYREALKSVVSRFPRLAQHGNRLVDLRDVSRRYAKSFLPDGSLADEASVALGRIRRDIERQKRSIQDSLDRFLRAHRTDGTLQEEFVTIRDDRYVVPIVAGQKGRVDGVIHGSSGTGRTLYVEPLETIALNNQLVRLREDELREIERILAEITNALREHAEEIASTAETLAQLDCVFARGGFARDYNAVIPRVGAHGRNLILREARHPLLETVFRKQRKTVVPVSFSLHDGCRVLLISGPNTGGKTVTMKTAGLLAIMAHAGIPVPCAEAEFPLLDDVLADIGDTQSIAESLSSFSGHLLHVKEMLSRVTAESLVLLDELGRATDPEEGGALGVAILDRFRESGAFCLASTHLLPLKIFGANADGVLNASMGFDAETLQPTYELRLGLPGQSAGLDIATRLEMPEPVLRHARSVLPRMQADLQQLLADLHRQAEEHQAKAAELDAARVDLERRAANLEQDAIKREQHRQREWQQKVDSTLRAFDARAEQTLDRIAELANQRKAADQAQRLLAKTRREFREEAAEAGIVPAELAPAVPAPPEVREGSRVRLRDIRDPATVRRVLKGDMLEVQAGFLKMQVPLSDVLEVVPPGAPHSLPRNVRLETGPRWDTDVRELNVIGQHAEEAVENVDKFLDSAALGSVNRVRIIHGHGMGILKRAVSRHLAVNPHVSRFYAATPSEGGEGATIVELRE